jgi:hypothetical protein
MNFSIKHIGNGYIESTVIEYATPITRADADAYASTVEAALDGTTDREHFAEVHELEVEAEELRRRITPTADSRLAEAVVKSNEVVGQVVDLLKVIATSIDAIDARVRQVEEVRRVISKRSRDRAGATP